MTWKSVFLIWLLALPFIGGVGFLAYRQNPKPFLSVASATQKGVTMASAAVQDFQRKQAAPEKPKKKKQSYY